MADAKKTVLVIDDEPDIVSVLKAILEGQGYRVSCGYDGSEVFDHLKKQMPDLLLIDWKMPTMNGLEVIRRLKESPDTSSLPVIMLTSMDRYDNVTAGYHQGADCYITKPFTKNQILNGINLVLKSRSKPGKKEIESHALPFLKACHLLSIRTKELASKFADADGLSPHDWIYKFLEARLKTDQNQTGTLKKDPAWSFCFSGWSVSFRNAKTGEQFDLAIGPGGRSDSFDPWRVQCYIENQNKLRPEFRDLFGLIRGSSDVPQTLVEHLSYQGWIEPARAEDGAGREEYDKQLGDRWVITRKGTEILLQTYPSEI